MKLIFKIIRIFAIVYAALFAVFYFDLDGKLLYYVYEPLMCKHYDNIEGRRNIVEIPYDMKEDIYD
ncbi:MAG: hypothetical protein II572_01225 [Clostridia bacterium]|nr:hypothetical protein [Oscillospiraceae bacterium]MBQ2016722.1 hypothetical protein [Clostridia bacterium]MBQ2567033.1 hypothetical protein [Clostridia bacterium]MBQ3995727.1 hypothetical protein [Clostridia bacterium]MBQ5480907.1 hypothetical protein [Clostridia bacterium]